MHMMRGERPSVFQPGVLLVVAVFGLIAAQDCFAGVPVGACCNPTFPVTMPEQLLDDQSRESEQNWRGHFKLSAGPANCSDVAGKAACAAIGGDYAGDGTSCATTICDQFDVTPNAVGGVSSRSIGLSFAAPEGPGSTFAIRVTSQCTGNSGYVSLRNVDYDDGAQGFVNIGEVNISQACDDAEFRVATDWVSIDGQLVIVGSVVTPESLFDLELVTGSCASQTIGAMASTVDSTWRYGDTTGDCSISFAGDLLKTFNNTSPASGQTGWAADDAAGIEVDVQGPDPTDIPDGSISFGADVLSVFNAIPSSGGQTFNGTTCPDVCP